MITLAGVEKRYGSVKAVAAIKLTAARGDRLFITGPNGSGKSTLLRIIAGISLPTRGAVRFAPGLGPIAFVPQSGGFYPHLTLLRHVEIWCRLYDRPSPADAAMTEAIDRLGLTEFLDRPLAALSGGYQKLAVLACAFGVSPAVLLLDEPLSGLDTAKAQAMTDLLTCRLPGLDLLMVTGHEPAALPGNLAVLRLGMADKG